MAEEKKEKQLTEMQQKFLDVLMTESVRGNIREAMRIAGYSDTTPSSVVINALYEEMIEAAKKVIAANSMKATMATIEVMDEPSALGAVNKLKAAQHILDRAGIVKKEEKQDVNLKVPKGGLFILPAKNSNAEPNEEEITEEESE